MDLLKRSLSPISDAAWQEIDEQARRVLRANLSARMYPGSPNPVKSATVFFLCCRLPKQE